MNAPFLTRGAEGLDRRGFTVADVFRLIETGVIDPDERFELIEGEIAPMAPEQSRHVVIKNQLGRALNALLPPDLIAIIDSTLYLSKRTFVEPDIYVAATIDDVAHTPARDVLLVIEVASSTMRRDMDLKASLYARAGISEYWVVNADSLVATVHRAPKDGAYGAITTMAPTASLSPERLAGVALAMADIATPR